MGDDKLQVECVLCRVGVSVSVVITSTSGSQADGAVAESWTRTPAKDDRQSGSGVVPVLESLNVSK